MLGKSRFSVSIFKITEVFLEAYFEGFSCLTDVPHIITCWAGYLIYPAFFIFVFGLLMPGCQEFSDSVFVKYAIFILVFLNTLLTACVSLPV